MIKETFVVEGLHDRQKIESVFPGAQCIVTNGTSLPRGTLELIRMTAATNGIILFLDPDHPGRTITNQLLQAVPEAKVAFLPRKEAISRNGRKVGIEHASASSIAAAVAAMRTVAAEAAKTVTIADLVDRGLAGSDGAAGRRETQAAKFGMPPCNAKTFIRWMNMLGIPAERMDD